MAANGNTGNTGTATSESAAKGQASTANANASNAANGKGNTGSTNTSTNTSSGATNSAGLMGSLIGFGNSITGNVGNTYGGSIGSDSKSDDGSELGIPIKNQFSPNAFKGKDDGKKSDGWRSQRSQAQDAIAHAIARLSPDESRNKLSADVVAKGDEAYTKAMAEGKTEAEAQYEARNAIYANTAEESSFWMPGNVLANAFEGKNTGPTIAKGSSEMGPSTPANAPAAPAANNAPGGNLGGETGGIVSGAAPTNVSDATNIGVTNRGSTVTNVGGTSVTDSGTGGSISSSVTPPSRDASSVGLGVYNTDRANYDQDNWNRGMEVESSSLVSDEECKAFAKRAFMENSEPFKKVRISIIKKC